MDVARAKISFNNVAMIGYLVKELNEKYPDAQVGKTVVQKMMFLLNRMKICDFNYTLYHYGPFSSEVANELDYASDLGIVEIEWEEDKGYFIRPLEKNGTYNIELSSDSKKAIDYLVSKYGRFNAAELSIIATGYYLMDNFGIQDCGLPQAVHEIKPKFGIEKIRNVLAEGLVTRKE